MSFQSDLSALTAAGLALGGEAIPSGIRFRTSLSSGCNDYGLISVTRQEKSKYRVPVWTAHYAEEQGGDTGLFFLTRHSANGAFAGTPAQRGRPMIDVTGVKIIPHPHRALFGHMEQHFRWYRMYAAPAWSTPRGQFLPAHHDDPFDTARKEEVRSAAEAALRLFRGFTAAVNENSFPWNAHIDLRESLLAARSELHPQGTELPDYENFGPSKNHLEFGTRTTI